MKTDLFNGCPKVLRDLYEYSNSLEFEDMPDYKMLKTSVRNAA